MHFREILKLRRERKSERFVKEQMNLRRIRIAVISFPEATLILPEKKNVALGVLYPDHLSLKCKE
jgi:hypothetical protein